MPETKKLALSRKRWHYEIKMRWTEKQIENFLTEETRVLHGTDGQGRDVTMFRTYWVTYDAVRVDDTYTEAELVDWAQRRVDEEGIAFMDAFRSNMGHLDHEIRRQNAAPVPPNC